VAIESLAVIPAAFADQWIQTATLAEAPGLVFVRWGEFEELIYSAFNAGETPGAGFRGRWRNSRLGDNGNGTWSLTVALFTNHHQRPGTLFWAPVSDIPAGPTGPQGAPGEDGADGQPSLLTHGFLMTDLASTTGETEGDVATVIGSSAAGDRGIGEQYRWTGTPEGSEDFHEYINSGSGQWIRLRQDKTLIISGTGTTAPPIGTNYIAVTANGNVIISLWDAARTPGHEVVIRNESTQLGATIVGGSLLVGASRHGMFRSAGGSWHPVGSLPAPYIVNASASGSIVLDYYGPRATYAFTLTGNVTITFPGASAGAQMGDTIDLLLMQDATGGRTTGFTGGADTGAYTLSNDTGNTANTKKFIRFVRAFDRWCATPRQTYTWA
jgi:hypothetical protein